MRIGIDLTCWANERGYGRFTREIVGALSTLARRHTLVGFLDERSSALCDLDGPHVERVIVPQRVSPTLAAAAGKGRSPADMLRFTREVWRRKPDVFFCPSVYGYFPLPPRLPSVVAIHDAIAERFPALTLPGWTDRLFWRAKVALAIHQSTLVLTVSDYAARDITRYLKVPPGRLRVSLEGVAAAYRSGSSAEDVRAAQGRIGLPPDAEWLMYVGGFGPHKHVDLLVRAHADLMARHRGRPIWLVLVGATATAFHEDLEGIRAAVAQYGSGHRVVWAGYLPDAEIRHLHAGALALVLPSAAEGFGLPAVEAAMCGTPVVATSESPLPHLLDGGGIFVEPGNVAVLAAALDSLVSDALSRAEMGRRARERAAELSWERSAAVTLAALEEAAGPLRSAA